MTAATLDDQREAWLADRRTVISGTDAAKVIGISPFGSPIDVYLDKLGLAQPRPVTEQMEAGKRFEPTILAWYADREGVAVIPADSHKLIRSALHSRIGATFDGFRCDQMPQPPIEVKNIGYPSAEWGDPGTDQVPLYYATQGILQMHVQDAPFVDFAVCFTGHRLAVYRLYRDHETEQDIVERCLAFWDQYITTETPPPVDGSASYSAWIGQRLKQQSEQILAAGPEHHAIALALVDVKGKLDELEMEKDRQQNLLKLAIGEARSLVGSTWKATWSTAKDSESVDYKAAFSALCRALDVNDSERDQVLTKHTTTRPGSRRFLFTSKE
jgi:putative phage-type endonuclease